MFCTLYKRNPGTLELAEAELGALTSGSSVEPGVWLSEEPVPWAETGFGKAGGRELAFGTHLEALRSEMLALNLVSPRIGISVRRVPKHTRGASAAKKVIADCIDGGVDYANPTLRLILVVSRLGYRVLEEADPGDGTWLETRARPHNLLVALPVRIAKAMLNLTLQPGDSVLDPFCGSGTIPLVAALAGHEATGSDISWKVVEQAAENAAHFGASVTLCRQDARASEQRADCVVSNLPYGVYCHLADETLREVLTSLKRMAPRVTLVTSEDLGEALVEGGFEVIRIVTVESERFERFVYLTTT